VLCVKGLHRFMSRLMVLTPSNSAAIDGEAALEDNLRGLFKWAVSSTDMLSRGT
jgi:hypothetical protein